MLARPYLLCVLILILCSLSSCKTVEPVFIAPKVDCAAFEPPKVQPPSDPSPSEKDPAIWQLFAYAWQSVAGHIMEQRIETAKCLRQLKQQGIVK